MSDTETKVPTEKELYEAYLLMTAEQQKEYRAEQFEKLSPAQKFQRSLIMKENTKGYFNHLYELTRGWYKGSLE